MSNIIEKKVKGHIKPVVEVGEGIYVSAFNGKPTLVLLDGEESFMNQAISFGKGKAERIQKAMLAIEDFVTDYDKYENFAKQITKLENEKKGKITVQMSQAELEAYGKMNQKEKTEFLNTLTNK